METTMKAVRVMSNYRLVFAFFALLSILGFSQPVLADFYVIPVGGPRIRPSDVVELMFGPIAKGTAASPTRITKSGKKINDFTIPIGKVLVVTLIRVEPASLGGTEGIFVSFFGKLGFGPFRIDVLLSQYEYSDLPYPSGLILDPEVPLSVAYWGGSPGTVTVRFFGYLTDDN
jgi:hypothetical protein